LFAVAITAWSYVGRYTDGISWAAISFFGTALVSYLVHPSAYRKMKPLFAAPILSKFVVLGLFYGIGSLTMLFAYRKGLFSVVTPVRQSSIIITTLLALLLLPSERDRITRKVLAAIACFAGVVMIVI
jgi:drug/metabolite transporter (DMT)-like permease